MKVINFQLYEGAAVYAIYEFGGYDIEILSAEMLNCNQLELP